MGSNITQRINEVMRVVSGVEKAEVNKHSNYRYAGHERVTEAIRAHFVRVGIVQQVSVANCRLLDGGHVLVDVEVTWSCHDAPESFVRGVIPALQHCQTRDGKPTAQQIGQALSYAVKNFTFKTLMLTGDTDVDSDATASPDEVTIPVEAQGFIDQIKQATTFDEIAAIGDEIQKWGKAGDTRGLRDLMAREFTRARERVRAKK